MFHMMPALAEGLPYLGISIRSLNDSPGMEIVAVNTESPAWHATLKHGDVLLEIEGQKVNKIEDYRSIIEQEVVKNGKQVLVFGVQRRG